MGPLALLAGTFGSLGACADPWAGAPALDPAVPTEAWRLSIAGHPVGVELRTVSDGGGRDVVRRRTLSLRTAAGPTTIRTASRVTCTDAPAGGEPSCRWSIWRDGRAVEGEGAVTLADVWPSAAASGRGSVVPVHLVDDAGARVDATLAREGSTVTIHGPNGVTTVTLDANGRPAEIRTGRFAAIRAEPGSEVLVPEPVDVARVLAIPTAAWPDARRSHVGIFAVDGAEVRVDAPTWLELPADRDRVRALMLEVADALTDRPTLGPGTGADALARGSGDCTEHALAFVERASAEGLSARTAAGRVYADTDGGPALVLHAWAEVALGGGWVGVDPALRQFPTDATHLRLADTPDALAAADVATIELRALR